MLYEKVGSFIALGFFEEKRNRKIKEIQKKTLQYLTEF